jgi:hypothetical protein
MSFSVGRLGLAPVIYQSFLDPGIRRDDVLGAEMTVLEDGITF